MIEAPRFSIIIPTVKADYLSAAIASVLGQEQAPSFEVLVLDDAAGPEIAAAVSPYLDNPCLRYERLTINLGASCPARTWNHGLSLVRGDWVVVLGDDDCLSSNALAEWQRLTEAYPQCSVLRLRLHILDHQGRVRLVLPPHAERESWFELALARFALARPLSLSEHAFRRCDLEHIGGFPELPYACGSDDQAVFMLAGEHGLAISNTAWAAWRRHGSNLSDAGVRPEQLQAMRRVACWLQDHIHTWQPRPDPASAQALELSLQQHIARIDADLAGLQYHRSWRGRLRSSLRTVLRRVGLIA